MNQICDTEECFRCGACAEACPKDAITLADSDDACSSYPVIDQALCIDCGVCVSSCQVFSPNRLRRAEVSIAAWVLDEDSRSLSSSGGIATMLGRSCIERGGVVYGAAYNLGALEMKRAESIQGVKRFRGSKYVAADMAGSYSKVKADLQKGLEVLYIATPCLVGGLKSFLRRDYDRLTTVDLICHGTPPQSFLMQHAEHVLKGGMWDKCAFRGGANDFCLTLYSKGKEIYLRGQDQDEYFSAFLASLSYRERCYSCPYARPERVGDITLGDYWGLDQSLLSKKPRGRVSLVLLNSDVGKRMYASCGDRCHSEELPFEHAVNKYQAQLIRPSTPHPDRGSFIVSVKELGFDSAVLRSDVGKSIRSRRRKQWLRSILSMRYLRNRCMKVKRNAVDYLWGLRRRRVTRKMRTRFGQNEITIISNNCSAGFIYNALGLQFSSPTINLYIGDDDFLAFVLNLSSYLNGALVEDKLADRDYPVGKLSPADGGRPIAVFFQHYEAFEQARDAWNRRKQRVHRNRFVVLWELLDCKKMASYSTKLEAAGIDYQFIVHDRRMRGAARTFVSEGYARAGTAGRLFDKRGVSGKRYIDEFDYVDWLKDAVK